MEKTMKLTDLVKDTVAEFVCYRDGDLWYKVMPTDPAMLFNIDMELPKEAPPCFDFPVPISDTGTGIFKNRMKGIELMRWIRKHLDKVNKGEWK